MDQVQPSITHSMHAAELLWLSIRLPYMQRFQNSEISDLMTSMACDYVSSLSSEYTKSALKYGHF